MRNFVADSVQRMRPSGIRRYFEIAATMQDVITLGIGEPDFSTPLHIASKGVECLEQGDTHYTANAGTQELREAIADYIQRLYGLHYDPVSQILVTVGVSEAMFLALRAIINPGEEVLVVEPCFVANPAMVEMVGGVPVPVDTYIEDDFQVTRASLEAKITPRTKAILISYPSNPTGAVLSRQNLEAIAALAQEYDLLVISDEIYERLVYEHTHINFATLPGMYERSIIMSGLSKSFAMTGWRVGYVTAAPELISAMGKLHQYLIMSAPTMSQVAALQALRHGDGDVEIMRRAI